MRRQNICTRDVTEIVQNVSYLFKGNTGNNKSNRFVLPPAGTFYRKTKRSGRTVPQGSERPQLSRGFHPDALRALKRANNQGFPLYIAINR